MPTNTSAVNKDHGESNRTLKACPECGSGQIRSRNSKYADEMKSARDKYHCTDCGARFQRPARREAHDIVAPKPRHGPAKRLYDLGREREGDRDREPKSIDEWLDDAHAEVTGDAK
jgi:transposase-like protein